jgi:hypothetical protein
MALGRARAPILPAGTVATRTPGASESTLTRQGPPERTMRVQRTPGATSTVERRSASDRGPSGRLAAAGAADAASSPSAVRTAALSP